MEEKKELPSFKCKDCEYTAKCKASLTRHYSHKHFGEFPCSICGKTLSSQRNLGRHEKAHSKVKSFECEICKSQFPGKIFLNRHMKIHRGKKLYECSLCDKKYKERVNLNVHIRSHTGEKPFKCSTCNKAFANVKQCREHEFVHKIQEVNQCFVCGKTYDHREAFNRHMRLHVLNDNVFECTDCGEQCTSASNLTTHMQIHSGNTSTSSGRNNHAIIPTIMKTSSCTDCGKKFSSKVVYNQGVQQNIVANLQCETCEKWWSRNANLNQSLKNVSGNPIKCFECNKIFASISLLTIHAQTHLMTVKKMYHFQCSFCSKPFVRRATAVSHMKEHHACEEEKGETSSCQVEKPYGCLHCELPFSSERSLEWHSVFTHDVVRRYKVSNVTSDAPPDVCNIDEALVARNSCIVRVNNCNADDIEGVCCDVDNSVFNLKIVSVKGAIKSKSGTHTEKLLCEPDVDLITNVDSEDNRKSLENEIYIKEESISTDEEVEYD